MKQQLEFPVLTFIFYFFLCVFHTGASFTLRFRLEQIIIHHFKEHTVFLFTLFWAGSGPSAKLFGAFLTYLLLKQIAIEENMKTYCAANDIWAAITRLQGTSANRELQSALVRSFCKPSTKAWALSEAPLSLCYHENILLVCASH